jgi:membrane protease subunit HflK
MNDAKTMDLDAGALIRLERAASWLQWLFLAGGVSLRVLTTTAPGVLLAGLSTFLVWCGFASLIQALYLRFERIDLADANYNCVLAERGSDDPPVTRTPLLPDFARRWQWVILVLAGLVLFSCFRPAFAGNTDFRTDQKTLLQIATAVLLATGCLLHFFSQFAAAVQHRLATKRLDALLALARMAFWNCLAGAGLVFLFLSTTWDFGAWLGWPLLALTLVLLLEPFLRLAARFYQPRGLHAVPGPVSESLLLDAVFGRGEGIQGALASFERLAGMKIGDMWLSRFLRRTLGWIVLGSLVVGWLSTSLTAVPAGSRGVRIVWGRYEMRALEPGLHAAWPWPFGRIEIIPTEQVRTVSLGFEQDLNEPVLWDQPHVTGEKNLLVGDGESLLTINIPILYRVSDAVAYATTSSDPARAMADLAERKLLHIMGSRDGFAVMIDDRAAIAQGLRADLQQEIDNLRLGIQIVFVGLQDIHPPVDVAPAYQEVVSAEEQMESTIDQARAYRARSLPAAQSEANTLTTQAAATSTAQVAGAQGGVSRFLSLATEDARHPGLLELRMRLEAIEKTLDQPPKTILAIPQTPGSRQFFLDLRGSTYPPSS